MFEILKKKEEAAPDELAAAFVEAEKFAETLEAEKEKIYSDLLELQKDYLGIEKNVPKELGDARNRFEGLKIKIESCQYGLKKLKERIAVAIPAFARKRIEEIKSEYSRLTNERHKRFLNFLKVAAQAVVLKEEIEWREFNFSNRLREPTEIWPSLKKFDPARLEEGDRKYFLGHVQKYREKSNVKNISDAIDKKLRGLAEESTRLKKSLEDFDPNTAVEDILNRFRPKVQSREEEQEDYSRKTTTIVYDYGENPVKTDYEEGSEPGPGVPTGVGFSVRRP